MAKFYPINQSNLFYPVNQTNLSWGAGGYGDVLAEFRSSLFTHREPSSIVLICLYVPVFMLAFCGNLLVLLVVLPNRKMRSVTNYFIVNMAVSDLLVTVICIPVAVGQSVYRFWVYGEFMCKITSYMQGVAVASSVFTIMALSVDRYLAIRHPMTFRAFSASHHAWKVVLVIWLLSFTIMIPLILVRQLELLDIIPTEVYYFCNELWSHSMHRQIYDGVLFIFLFILPGCFVTASYSRIGCQLWTEGHTLYRTDSAHGKQQADRVMSGRRRVARMLIVLAVLFAVCWMPYHLLSIYIDFQKRANQPALKALPFTILLGYSNSALNPVLYCSMHRNFRNTLRKLCGCKKKTKLRRNRLVHRTPYTRARPPPQFAHHVLTRTSSSRSSSTSLKFSSGSWRCHTKSTHLPPLSPVHIQMEPIRHCSTGSDRRLLTHPDSSPLSPPVRLTDVRTRREIFHFPLDIPTTINEESQSSHHGGQTTPDETMPTECHTTANYDNTTLDHSHADDPVHRSADTTTESHIYCMDDIIEEDDVNVTGV